MSDMSHRIFVSNALCLMLAGALATAASAQQQTPIFTPGNLVVTVEGCGDPANGGCTSVQNGTGNGTGNSSTGGYGDNEAAPLTLFQFAPNGTSSVTFVNSLVLPQAFSGANLPVSGEYGSSSEGTLQLDGTGRYLTLMGYGIDAPTFDAAYHPATPPGSYTTCGAGGTGDPFGAAPSGALAQSGSLTGQCYTPIPRVIALIDAYGNINSSTAIYNVFNTNNPRSAYTLDGSTSAYVSGQGTGCDGTGGVFYVPLLNPTTAPVAITGNDGFGGNNGCPGTTSSTLLSQDTRDVQIYNNTLYISMDSKEGSGTNRSLIGTLGTPPSTTLFTDASNPGQVGSGFTGPLSLSGFANGKTGKITITTGAGTNGNNLNNSTTKVNGAALDAVNLSPVTYFFASPSVLYVADSGNPKNDSNGDNNSSGTTNIGDGGLQKWVNSQPDGSGTWSLAYTLYQGLGLVNNGGASGTTGLYALAGVVNGSTVYLYATNYNINDLDPTYLYGITDTLTTTTNPGTTFTQLAAAPADSNFKGVSFAPSLPAGSATITSAPSGLAFTTSGTGCAPGTYTTPVTLLWTPGSACQLTVVSPQSDQGNDYVLTQWQDGTTSTTDGVTAPTTSAVFNATFGQAYQLSTSAGTGGTVSAGGYFAVGSSVPITATPNTGYYFVNWTGSADISNSSSASTSITMNSAESIVANFAPQVMPTITWPTATSITYGQTLASSTLTGGSALSGNTPVAGTFAFTLPGTAPTAGTQLESVTFTPTITDEYLPVTTTVSVLVNQAPTTISVLPTASAVTYGQTLASSTLSGGTAISTITNAGVSGTFTFTTPTTAPPATGLQSVTFTPTDTGNYLGTTTSVPVTVTPVPIASISTPSIDFGTLYLGSIVTKPVNITNTGDAAMTINDPRIAIVSGGNSNEFVTLNLCPKSLAAGHSCTMTVTFIAGPFYTPQTATLMIQDNATGSPQSVPLTATVINPLAAFNPSSLSFGKVKANSATSAESVTVTSVGATALTISNVAITGVNPGDFSETDNCASKMFNPKASCSIVVTFAPTVKGLRSAILVVTDNAHISSQSIPLSGTGN